MDHPCASQPISSCIIQPNGNEGKCGLAPWVSSIAVSHRSFRVNNKGILNSVEDSSEILQEFVKNIAKQPTKI